MVVDRSRGKNKSQEFVSRRHRSCLSRQSFMKKCLCSIHNFWLSIVCLVRHGASGYRDLPTGRGVLLTEHRIMEKVTDVCILTLSFALNRQ